MSYNDNNFRIYQVGENYTEYSERERALTVKLFEKLNITTYNMTSIHSKERYDGTFTSISGKLYMFETKVRNYEAFQLLQDGAYIEVSKLKYLFREANKTNRIPVVINFTSDNKAIVYNVKKFMDDPKLIRSQKIIRRMNAHSANSRDESKKVDKICLELLKENVGFVIDDIKLVEPEVIKKVDISKLVIKVNIDKTYSICNINETNLTKKELIEYMLKNVKDINSIEEANKLIDENYTTINILNFFK